MIYKVETIQPLEGNIISLDKSNILKFKINNDKIQPSSICLQFNDSGIVGELLTTFSRYVDFLPFIDRIRVYDEENNNSVFFDCDAIDKYSKLHGPLTKDFNNNDLQNGFLQPSQRTVLNGVDSQSTQDPLMPYDITIANSLINSISNNAYYKKFPGFKYSSQVGGGLAVTYFRINLKDLIPDSIFGINKFIYLKNYIIEITFFNHTNIYSQNDDDPVNALIYQGDATALKLKNICLKFNTCVSNDVLEIDERFELDFFETKHFTDNTIYLNNILNNTDTLTKVIFGYLKKDVGSLLDYMSNTLYFDNNPQTINSYSIFYNGDLIKSCNRLLGEDFHDILGIVNKNNTSIINYDIFKVFTTFVLIFADNINSKQIKGITLNHKNNNLLRFEYNTDITDKFDYFISIHKKYVIINGKIYKDKI